MYSENGRVFVSLEWTFISTQGGGALPWSMPCCTTMFLQEPRQTGSREGLSCFYIDVEAAWIRWWSFLFSYRPIVVAWDRRSDYLIMRCLYTGSVWTFHLKYLKIKKIYLKAMSPLFKHWLPFKSLCVCAWWDSITASRSVWHYNLIFNITIQIISVTLTTLMERRAKFWWAGIWRTEMWGVRGKGFKIHLSLVLINGAQRAAPPETSLNAQ